MGLSLNCCLCWPHDPDRVGPTPAGERSRGSALQVRLFAGTDPVTGRDVYLTASIPGTDKKAHKRAEDKLAEFRTQVNKPHRDRAQPRALSAAEQQTILDELHRDRFADLAPAEVWRSCSTRASTSARSPPSTGCCAVPAIPS